MDNSMQSIIKTTGNSLNIFITSLDCGTHIHSILYTLKFKITRNFTRISTHKFVYVKHKRANVQFEKFSCLEFN